MATTEQTDLARGQCGIWRRLTRDPTDLYPEAGNGARAERSRSNGEVRWRCVPGGRGAPRAGRARASSAPPRARAARRSQNPSRRALHLVAGLASNWFRGWVRRVAHCDGRGAGAMCEDFIPEGEGERCLQPLAHANANMRCALAVSPRLALASGSPDSGGLELSIGPAASRSRAGGLPAIDGMSRADRVLGRCAGT